MHVIEGKAVTKYHIGTMFMHVGSITGTAALCKLQELDETSGADVFVQYYLKTSITHTKWSQPVKVKCAELHWYKVPNFTAADLLK